MLIVDAASVKVAMSVELFQNQISRQFCNVLRKSVLISEQSLLKNKNHHSWCWAVDDDWRAIKVSADMVSTVNWQAKHSK